MSSPRSQKSPDKDNGSARSKLQRIRSFRESRSKTPAAKCSLVKNYFSEDSWLALLAELSKSDENLLPQDSEQLLDEDEKKMMSDMKEDCLDDAVRMYGEEARRQSVSAQWVRQHDWSGLIGHRVEYTGPPTELRESSV